MSETREQIGLESRVSGARGVSGGAHAPPANVFTVLHIDDDPNDIELLRAAASRAKAHFNLQNVEDGEKAIAYLTGAGMYADRHSFPLPALILLDIKMPRATGLEMLKWIRQNPEFVHLPVVVLSGSELHEDIRQAYAIGANSYLIKPLGFEALVDLVRDVKAVWLHKWVSPAQ